MKTHRLWILLATLLAPRAVYAQIYRLAEMNSDQVRGLDHEKTVILIPGGILEEHGPYLPTYTDGYADRYYTQKLANAIAARPGWKVVVFPEIPLGFGGANNIGAKWDFPGTYTVRLSTLRSVYMDLASDLGAQKFRWILVVHDHGDPAHNQALAQASDYFHDMYGGTMLHLFGLTEVQGCYDIVAKLLSKKASAQDGFTVHAGAEEHSEILFLHPELANPAYKTELSSQERTSTISTTWRRRTAGRVILVRHIAQVPRSAGKSWRPARRSSTPLLCGFSMDLITASCPASTTSLIPATRSATKPSATMIARSKGSNSNG
jgi:creatinine amidohydrolase/Fe(II)-dependent formamide hydrolase-like protein